jgi:HSP20 family molecular chaperone IbpA
MCLISFPSFPSFPYNSNYDLSGWFPLTHRTTNLEWSSDDLYIVPDNVCTIITDTINSFKASFKLAGIKKESVSVSVRGQTISITVKQNDNVVKDYSFTTNLKVLFVPESVTAKMVDGLLIVEAVPEKEKVITVS